MRYIDMGISKVDRKWLVITAEEYANLTIDWSLVGDVDDAHVRWSNDKSKCIMKYNGAKPPFLSSITGVINHDAILELLLTDDWIHPDANEI